MTPASSQAGKETTMETRPSPLVQLGAARRVTRANKEFGMFELLPVTRYEDAG